MEDEIDIIEVVDNGVSRRRSPFLRSSSDRDIVSEGIQHSSSKTKYRSGEGSSNKLTTVTEVYSSSSKVVRGKSGSSKVSSNSSETSSVVAGAQKRRRPGRPPSKRNLLPNGIPILYSNVETTTAPMDSSDQEDAHTQVEQRSYKTSDYSSDEGQTKNGAFHVYKRAGEWWNKFPKTDYTYSPISPDRKEVAPGVIAMPNMSRRSIHLETSGRAVTSTPAVRSRWFSESGPGTRIPPRLASWVADSDVDEVDEAAKLTSAASSSRGFFLTRVFTTIWTFFSSIYHSVVETVTKFGQRNDSRSTPRWMRGEPASSSWLKRFITWYYVSMGYVMIMDTWLLSRLTSSRRRHTELDEDTPKPRRLRYFAFLLIPPLLLAGWWFCSDLESPIDSALAVIKTTENSSFWWLYSPFHFKSMKEDEVKLSGIAPVPVTVQSPDPPLMRTRIDVEDLVNRVLGSKQFQQELHASAEREREKLQQELDRKDHLLAKQQDQYSLLTDELVHVRREVEHLSSQLQSKRDSGVVYTSPPLWRRRLRELDSRMKVLEEDRLYLTHKISECCKDKPLVLPVVAIEEHVTKFLSGLFDAEGGAEGKMPAVHSWIKRLFVAKDDLEAKLANITSSVNIQVREASDDTVQIVMAAVSEQIKNEFIKQQASEGARRREEARGWVDPIRSVNCSLTAADVRDIVNNALVTYDADKTGMVDYALESSGGSILSTRCTETYSAKSAILSWLGLPFWSPTSNPRIVIQPGVHPGQCWAFSGVQGFLVIRLTGRVQVTAFSLEHIPVALSPTGNIASAPKDFSVWGLKSEQDTDPEMLGKYRYQQNGTSLQVFKVQRDDVQPLDIVELRIETNHGNLEYTCLYRFRVHGVLTSK